jgi:hypothetical protein
MRNVRVLLTSAVPAFVLFAGLTVTGSSALAQNSAARQNRTQQQNEQPSTDPGSAKQQAFSGKIMKANGELVLVDADNKTTYRLNDQQKAGEFLNKNVKITGVLDQTTGTIRISSIEPA